MQRMHGYLLDVQCVVDRLDEQVGDNRAIHHCYPSIIVQEIALEIGSADWIVIRNLIHADRPEPLPRCSLNVVDGGQITKGRQPMHVLILARGLVRGSRRPSTRTLTATQTAPRTWRDQLALRFEVEVEVADVHPPQRIVALRVQQGPGIEQLLREPKSATESEPQTKRR